MLNADFTDCGCPVKEMIRRQNGFTDAYKHSQANAYKQSGFY
jgi:hypothetical protein